MNPWLILLAVAGLVGSNLWSYGQGKIVGAAGELKNTEKVEAAFSEYRDEVREKELEFERKVLAAERRAAKLQSEVLEAYEQGKQDAEAESIKLVSDLRAGNVRLRQQWAGCRADNVSATSTIAALTDEAARDREESAARIVRAARDADDQIRALQQLLRAQHAMINAGLDPPTEDT